MDESSSNLTAKDTEIEFDFHVLCSQIGAILSQDFNSLSWFVDSTRFVWDFRLRQGYVTTTNVYKVGFYF